MKNFLNTWKRKLGSLYYENRKFYVYECRLTEKPEIDTIPCINNITAKIISTKQELDELVAGGYLFSLNVEETKFRLEKGAVLFLFLCGNELASLTWVAATPQAKASFNNYPYMVNFHDHEICLGAVWTNPKFRNNGLMTYSIVYIRNVLREQGFTVARSVVEQINSVSLKVMAKYSYNTRITHSAQYIRLLGLQYWKERPYDEKENRLLNRVNGVTP